MNKKGEIKEYLKEIFYLVLIIVSLVLFYMYISGRIAKNDFEKDFLIKKIQENGGNISKTAEAIGLERSYLHRKIKAYGIEVNL